MHRLTIGQGVRDDARTQDIGVDTAVHEASEADPSRASRISHHAAAHYDWMDHHSTFDTSEW
jgi:hypothetical protein